MFSLVCFAFNNFSLLSVNCHTFLSKIVQWLPMASQLVFLHLNWLQFNAPSTQKLIHSYRTQQNKSEKLYIPSNLVLIIWRCPILDRNISLLYCLCPYSVIHCHKLIMYVTCCFLINILPHICHMNVKFSKPFLLISCTRNFNCLLS